MCKTIKVTEKEFHITLSTRTGAVGPVRFVIKNTGKYTHGLAISGPGVKLKKSALIKPGKSAILAVTLKSGTYALWCPVPGHAAKGMKTSIKVPGASTGGGGGGSGGGEPDDHVGHDHRRRSLGLGSHAPHHS